MAELSAAFRIAHASLPYPGECVSGDDWVLMTPAVGRVVLAVVDAAGHGEEAHAVAGLALSAFQGAQRNAPAEILSACHGALHGTRGAVATLAYFDIQAGTVCLAGVGNVSATLWLDGREQHFIAQRGMLGSRIPTVRPVEYQLTDDWLLTLHTDGIRTQFSLDDPSMRQLAAESLESFAEQVVADFHRVHDDALLVAVGPL